MSELTMLLLDLSSTLELIRNFDQATQNKLCQVVAGKVINLTTVFKAAIVVYGSQPTYIQDKQEIPQESFLITSVKQEQANNCSNPQKQQLLNFEEPIQCTQLENEVLSECQSKDFENLENVVPSECLSKDFGNLEVVNVQDKDSSVVIKPVQCDQTTQIDKGDTDTQLTRNVKNLVDFLRNKRGKTVIIYDFGVIAALNIKVMDGELFRRQLVVITAMKPTFANTDQK